MSPWLRVAQCLTSTPALPQSGPGWIQQFRTYTKLWKIYIISVMHIEIWWDSAHQWSRRLCCTYVLQDSWTSVVTVGRNVQFVQQNRRWTLAAQSKLHAWSERVPEAALGLLENLVHFHTSTTIVMATLKSVKRKVVTFLCIFNQKCFSNSAVYMRERALWHMELRTAQGFFPWLFSSSGRLWRPICRYPGILICPIAFLTSSIINCSFLQIFVVLWHAWQIFRFNYLVSSRN